MLALSMPEGGISPTSVVETVTTIIYNQYQMPMVCNLVEYPLEVENNLLVIRDKHSRGNDYFMTIKVTEKIGRDLEQSI